MRRIAIGFALLALAASPVLADCKAELAEVDKLLADTEDIPDHLMQVLRQMRDQGAAACEAGNETSAGAAFKSVTMMLGMQTQTAAPEPAPEPEPAPAAAALPEAHTVYISSSGEGILRYTVPGGEGRKYSFVTGALTGDARRPFETMGSDGAIFTGPHIARWLWGIDGRHIPIDRLAFSLYDRESNETVALFKLVVDDSKAEPKANCGEVNSRTDECSKKLR